MNTFEIPVSQKAYDQAIAWAYIDHMEIMGEYRKLQIPMPTSYLRYAIYIALDFIEALRSHSGDSPQLSEATERLSAVLIAMPGDVWADSEVAT